jgi:hypothetical protein
VVKLRREAEAAIFCVYSHCLGRMRRIIRGAFAVLVTSILSLSFSLAPSFLILRIWTYFSSSRIWRFNSTLYRSARAYYLCIMLVLSAVICRDLSSLLRRIWYIRVISIYISSL